MDSTTHFQDQNPQQTSGLLRYRSAPSSFLSTFTETLDSGVHLNLNKVSIESEESLISRFANSGGGNGDKSRTMAAEVAVSYANSPRSYSGLPPHYPRQSSTAMDVSCEFLGLENQTPGKSLNSSLLRQTSSPPGLFANLSVQNGYASMKDVGNYGGVNGDVSVSSNRLKSQVSFPSRLPSSLGMLPQISEIGTESIETRSLDDEKHRTSNGDGRFYGTDLLYGSWNDTLNFRENYFAMKREQDDGQKLFAQNGDLGGRYVSSHHLSLPKTSMENLLYFQDSVPCKVRAKRGCATHPRSIAERVRRTRISERMRKLQELVPNMDKQTNTSDMLDLAVEHIKELEKQFKTLSNVRAKCKCLNVQKPESNRIV